MGRKDEKETTWMFSMRLFKYPVREAGRGGGSGEADLIGLQNRSRCKCYSS